MQFRDENCSNVIVNSGGSANGTSSSKEESAERINNADYQNADPGRLGVG